MTRHNSGMPRLIIRIWGLVGPQAIRYLIVGGIGVLMNTVLLYALTEYALVWYIYSNWIATIISQLVAFLGYKYWAFLLRTSRAAYSFAQQFLIHWAVWGMGLAIGTGILYSLTTYLHVWYVFSSFVATAISGTSNFLCHRFLTYKPTFA